MAKQIKRSEIAEKDLYKNIRDSAEQTIEFVEYLNESLRETAQVLNKQLKQPLKVTLEGINGLNDGAKVMNETMEQSIKLDKAKADALKTQIDAEAKLEKLEQERIKTQIQENKLAQEELKLSKQQNKQDKESEKLKKQLTELEDEQVKGKIRHQKANQAQKKALTDELILQDKQAGTLEKLAASSRKLRREREKLNLETDEGKKRLKEINDELDDNNEVLKENSDALKKQKLNVGNYTESVKKALGPLGDLIGGIKDSIDGLKDQAKAFLDQAKAADTSAKKIRLVGKAIKASGIGLLVAMLGAVVGSFTDTREGVLLFQGTMAKASAIVKLAGHKIVDTFTGIGLKVKRIGLVLQEAMNPLTKDPEIQKSIEDIDGELLKLSTKEYKLGDILETIDKAIKKTFEYEDALAKATLSIDKNNKALEELRGQEELLEQRTGDATLSFKKQRQAQAEYNKVVTERITKEKELAQLNLDVKALKIREQLEGRFTLQQIKNLEFLKDEDERMRISSDALAELAEAKENLMAKDNELRSALEKNSMEQRNTDKDDFEKQLDFAIDAFDVQKSINERIINSEKTTLAEREALTEETRRLADSSFDNQVKLVEDYTKQKLHFDKLLKMSDEEEIRRTLDKNDLNDTTLTRILEILKERKIVIQDLAEIEEETDKKRLENNEAISDSMQNIEQDDFDLRIELMEKEFDREKELQEESAQQLKRRLGQIKDVRIKQLRDQAKFDRLQVEESIGEEDKKAEKIKEINSKLQNDIIRLDNETFEAKKEIDEEEVQSEEAKAEKLADIRKQRAEDANAIAEAVTEAHNTFVDKRIAKIDEEIAAGEKKFDSLQELANNGNILAQQSMAEEAKLIAEQTRKREQMEKRKQRVQLASTVLQAYLTNSADPDVKKPLQKTITDTVLLTEFIKALPGLFDGTEDTGKHGLGVDGKGGFLSVLHPNERVLPKKNNDMIGNMSNDELSQLAYKYQNGLVRDVADGLTLSNDLSGVSILADKLDSLERTISNKPEHNLEVEQIIDGAMAITRSTRRGNTKVYNRYRVGK